jgi:hypothetical protein
MKEKNPRPEIPKRWVKMKRRSDNYIAGDGREEERILPEKMDRVHKKGDNDHAYYRCNICGECYRVDRLPVQNWQFEHVCPQRLRLEDSPIKRSFFDPHPVLPVSPLLADRIARMQAAKVSLIVRSQMSYRCAGGEEMREFELAAAAVGQVVEGDLAAAIPAMGRKQIAREVSRNAVDICEAALKPYKQVGYAAVVGDAVTIMGHGKYVFSAANALLGVAPAILGVIGDFAGDTNAYVQAGETIAESFHRVALSMVGGTFDNQPLQMSVFGSFSSHFCWNDPPFSGFETVGCTPHTIALGVRDAAAHDVELANCLDGVDRLSEALDTKFVRHVAAIGPSPQNCKTRWLVKGNQCYFAVSNFSKVISRVNAYVQRLPKGVGGVTPLLVTTLRGGIIAVAKFVVQVWPYLCATADASADDASVGDVFALLFAAKRQADLNNDRFERHRVFDRVTSDVIFNAMIQRFEGGPSGAIRVLTFLLTPAGRAWYKAQIGDTPQWWLGEEEEAHREAHMQDVVDLLSAKFHLDQNFERIFALLDGHLEDWLAQCDDLVQIVQGRARMPRRLPTGVEDDGLPGDDDELIDLADLPEDVANEMALISNVNDESDETWEPEVFQGDDQIPVLDLAVQEALDPRYLRGKAVDKLAEITERYNRRPGAQGLPVQMVLNNFARWLDEPLPGIINLHGPLRAVWADVHTFIPALRPLCFIAQRILAIPASEAHSERAIGRLRRIFGDFRSALSNASETAELMLGVYNASVRGG